MGQPISSDLQFLIFIIMSTTSGQNLSLGKLRRVFKSVLHHIRLHNGVWSK